MFSLKFRTWGFKANALRYCFLAASLLAVVLTGEGGVAVAIVGYIAISILRNIALRWKV
jgi:CDP-diacylglycerol--serine O-phosphatidyltransferase